MGPSAIESSSKRQLKRFSLDLATQRATGHFSKGNFSEVGGEKTNLAMKGKASK